MRPAPPFPPAGDAARPPPSLRVSLSAGPPAAAARGTLVTKKQTHISTIVPNFLNLVLAKPYLFALSELGFAVQVKQVAGMFVPRHRLVADSAVLIRGCVVFVVTVAKVNNNVDHGHRAAYGNTNFRVGNHGVHGFQRFLFRVSPKVTNLSHSRACGISKHLTEGHFVQLNKVLKILLIL